MKESNLPSLRCRRSAFNRSANGVNVQLLQSIEMTAVSFQNKPAAFRFSVRTLTADTADVCEGLDISDLTGDRTQTTLIKSQVHLSCFCYETILMQLQEPLRYSYFSFRTFRPLSGFMSRRLPQTQRMSAKDFTSVISPGIEPGQP